MAAKRFSGDAPVSRRVRAYFAPVGRAAQLLVPFDPAQQGGFDLDAPPSPWLDLGWIQGFTRKAATKIVPIMTGIPAAPLCQVRETVDAQVTFQFSRWTKLTMALATSSQHMNMLANTTGNRSSTANAVTASAISIEAGSTATGILLAAADAARLFPGSIIAIDQDYSGQTGFVGSPISGAYLRNVLTDVDYIRRITFNIGVISGVTSIGITLSAPLPGGAPAPGAKLQAVSGFVDREGGTFFQEWSALFVIEGSQGERVFFHYPRLQSMGSAEETALPLAGKDRGGWERSLLEGRFIALPVIDPLDGERILCYRSYLPCANALT